MNFNKLLLWSSWVLITLVLTVYFTGTLQGEDKSTFLPGETTHGHYQIEMACDACHTTFDGVKQDACLDCHAAELELADDSHPESKFADPRNANLLLLIDAEKCVTCHVEHRPDMTRKIGVTQPPDYCIYCHQDIAEDRPSHEGMPFDTCRGACHNYHDNMALYEDFLVKNLHQSDTYEKAVVIDRDFLDIYRQNPKYPIKQLTLKEHDAPEGVNLEAGHDWEGSTHADAGVNCMACHGIEQSGMDEKVWVDKPNHQVCENCHDQEVAGFLAGRHGMRLAAGLSPMRTDMARLPMKPVEPRELNCVSCHKSHEFSTDPRHTAVESCLKCHADDHSRAYKASPHFRLWNEELKGQMPPGSGVSCATCHLPREVVKHAGVERTLVQHNQNFNLRPSQKMARSVCMNCHGLGFTLDALADPELARNNYSERPSVHIGTLEMAEKRLENPKASEEGEPAPESEVVSETVDEEASRPEPVTEKPVTDVPAIELAPIEEAFGHSTTSPAEDLEITEGGK
jgi:hypothetical protein